MRLASLLILTCLVCSGCMATKSAIGTVSIKEIRSFYVVHLPGDKREINKIISARLNQFGVSSQTGDSGSAPPGVQAIITYQDRWRWDMTNYMSSLSVQVRDPVDSRVIVTATSSRSSLQRTTPEEMVGEVLGEIFENQMAEEDLRLMASFTEGKASMVTPGLLSGFSEAIKAGLTVEERKAFHDQGAWEALALTVLKDNYGDDLSWFYLGRAAEELGFRDPALLYYGKSVDTSKSPLRRCLGPVCSGFSLPSNAQERIDKMLAAGAD